MDNLNNAGIGGNNGGENNNQIPVLGAPGDATNPNNLLFMVNSYITEVKNQLAADLNNNPPLSFDDLKDRLAKLALLLKFVNDNSAALHQNNMNAANKFFLGLKAGQYDQGDQVEIEHSKERIDTIYNRLNIRKNVILPDSSLLLAIGGEELTDDKLARERDEIVKKNKADVDLYQRHPVGGFTPDLKKAIKEDLGFSGKEYYDATRAEVIRFFETIVPANNNQPAGNAVDPAEQERIQHINELKLDNLYLGSVGLVTSRSTTNANNFVTYLMGRENNPLTYQQAIALKPGTPDFNTAFAEYRTFLRANPVGRVQRIVNARPEVIVAPSAQEKALHLERWCGIFSRAAQNLMKNGYQIPEIDFSDPNKVDEHFTELNMMANFVLDFNQNLPGIQRNASSNPVAVKNFKEKIQPVVDLQNFFNPFDKALNFESVFSNGNSMGSFLKTAAVRRIWFEELARKYAGKTLAEIHNDKNPEKMCQAKMILSIETYLAGDDTITNEEAYEYLKGNNPGFIEKAKQFISSKEKEVRETSINDLPLSGIKRAFSSLETNIKSDLADGLNGLNEQQRNAKIGQLNDRYLAHGENFRTFCRETFSAGKNLNEINQALQTDMGNLLNKAATEFYSGLFIREGLGDFYKYVQADPLDTIRINGQTLRQKFGNKYAEVEDAGQKNQFLMMELINNIVNGNDHITIDRYALNDQNQMVKAEEITLFRRGRQAEKVREFLVRVRELKEFFRSYRGKRVSIAELENPSAAVAQANQRVSQALYRIDDCCSFSALANDADCNYPTLKAAMTDYVEKVNELYNLRRDELNREKRDLTDAQEIADVNRKIETLESEWNSVLDGVDKKITELERLSKSCKCAPGAYERNKPEEYSFRKLEKNILEDEQLLRSGRKSGIGIGMSLIFLSQQFRWVQDLDQLGENGIPDHDIGERIHTEADLDPLENIRLERGVLGRAVIEGKLDGSKIIQDIGRVASLFNIWALGKEKEKEEEEEYKVEDLAGLQKDTPENRKLWMEFQKFVLKNPAMKQKNETPEARQKRIGAWTKLMKNARHKIENYRIPEIDYTDFTQNKKDFANIFLLRNIGIDGVQEWDNIISGAPYSELREIAGGDREYQDLTCFYSLLQNSFGVIDSYAKYVASPDADMSSVRSAIEARYKAEIFVAPYKGQTVGEFFENSKNENANLEMIAQEMQTLIYEGKVKALSNSLVVGAALGVNPHLLKDALNNRRTMAEDRLQNGKYLQKEYEKFAEYRNNCLNEEVRFLLLNSGDSAEEMAELLNTELSDRSNGNTVSDFIAQTMYKGLFTTDYYGLITNNLGLEFSEVFLIGGKKPSEIWGEKYEEYEDKDKEDFYRLEVLKTIAKGEEPVSMRVFLPAGKNEIEEKEAATVFETKKQMDQLCRFAGDYTAERDLLLYKLKGYRDELISTQGKNHKEDNFFNENTTGTEVYYTMCFKLQYLIEILEKDIRNSDEADPEEIEKCANELQEAAETYYNARYGRFWRPFTDDGTKRLEVSYNIKESVKGMFLYFRGFLNHSIISNKETFKKTTFRDIRTNLTNMKTSMNLPLPDEKVQYNKIIQRELRYKLEKLNSILKQRGTSREKEEVVLAKKYLLAYFDARVKATTSGSDAYKQNMSDIEMIDSFDEKVKELAANPVFVKYMKENPQACINRWNEIEKKEERFQRDEARKLERFTDGFASLSHFVAGAKGDRTFEGVVEEARHDEYVSDILLGGIYSRLAKVVVAQMLSGEEEEHRQFRLNALVDAGMYDRYLKLAERYLRGIGALDQRNYTGVPEKIQSKTFMKNFMKVLPDRLAAETSRRNEVNAQPDTKVDTILSTLNSNPESDQISEQEKANLRIALSLDKETTALNKANECANLLIEGKDLQVYKNCGLADEEGNITPMELQSLFIYYLITHETDPATNKIYSLDEAIRLSNLKSDGNNENVDILLAGDIDKANELRNKFYDYCKRNQVTLENPGEGQNSAKDSINNWASLYCEGNKILLQSELPDIHYSDPKEVKENLDKLNVISNLCSNLPSAFDGIIDGYGSNKECDNLELSQVVNIVSKMYDSNDPRQYISDNNALLAIAENMTSYKKGYGKSLIHDNTNSKNGLKREIIVMAAERTMAGWELENYAGGTLLNFAKADLTASMCKELLEESIAAKLSGDVNGIDVQNATELLVDRVNPGHSFADAFKPVYESSKKDARRVFFDLLGKHAVQFRDDFLTSFNSDHEGVMDELLENTDSAKDMKDFFDKGIDNVSGDTLLKNTIDKFFDKNMKKMCEGLNILESDMFLIEGKTPSQIWGLKYHQYKDDQETLDRLYKLEIVKEIMKNEQSVSIRRFVAVENHLAEVTPIVFLPRQEELERLITGALVFEKGMREVSGELDEIKSQLEDANEKLTKPETGQKDLDEEDEGKNSEELKKSVKSGKSAGVAEEKLSRTRTLLTNLIEAIDKTIGDNNQGNRLLNDVEEEKAGIEDILRMFDEVEQAAASEMKKPAVIPEDENDPVRILYEQTQKLLKRLPEMKKQIAGLHHGFDSGMLTGEGETLANASYRDVKNSLDSMVDLLGLEEPSARIVNQKYLHFKLERMVENYRSIPDPGIYNPGNYGRAREYVLTQYMRKDHLTEEDLENLQDTYDEHVKDLADNEIFQWEYQADFNRTVKYFGEVEDGIKRLRSIYEKELGNIRTQTGTLSVYVAKETAPIDRGKNALKTANKNAVESLKEAMDNKTMDPEEKERMIEGMYDRLAYAVALQVLETRSPLSKYLLSKAAIQGEDYLAEEFIFWIKDTFKDSKVLGSKKVTETMKKLEDGSLATLVESTYLKELTVDYNNKKKETQKETEKETQKETDLQKETDIQKSIEEEVPEGGEKKKEFSSYIESSTPFGSSDTPDAFGGFVSAEKHFEFRNNIQLSEKQKKQIELEGTDLFNYKEDLDEPDSGKEGLIGNREEINTDLKEKKPKKGKNQKKLGEISTKMHEDDESEDEKSLSDAGEKEKEKIPLNFRKNAPKKGNYKSAELQFAELFDGVENDKAALKGIEGTGNQLDKEAVMQKGKYFVNIATAQEIKSRRLMLSPGDTPASAMNKLFGSAESKAFLKHLVYNVSGEDMVNMVERNEVRSKMQTFISEMKTNGNNKGMNNGNNKGNNFGHSGPVAGPKP